MPQIDWTGEIGGMLGVAAFLGASFTAGTLYKFMVMPLKKEVEKLRADNIRLFERIIEAVKNHD